MKMNFVSKMGDIPASYARLAEGNSLLTMIQQQIGPMDLRQIATRPVSDFFAFNVLGNPLYGCFHK